MTNLVIIKDNQAMTTSRMVAATFEKQHKDVLKSINNIVCSSDFHQRNFAPMFYTSELGNGATRQDREVGLTRDGFTFLAMGYTGKKASQFKEAYIKAFNEMEASLKNQVEIENKYTIEDLIIAQANSIKELKSEVQAMQLALTEKLPIVPPLKIEVGQQILFNEENGSIRVRDYLVFKNIRASHSERAKIGLAACRYSADNQIPFKYDVRGNLYQPTAIEFAISKVIKKETISTEGVKNPKDENVIKSIAYLKKNPLAQDLKTIPIGKSKNYRATQTGVLKYLIYHHIHKCTLLVFNINTSSSRGWTKVRRVK